MTTVVSNASVYSTLLRQRLMTSSDFLSTSLPVDVTLMTSSSNVTSYLRDRAEVTWSEIDALVDTVTYSDVIVESMTQRVMSLLASLATSRALRASVNVTLSDLEPLDITTQLQAIGMTSEIASLFYCPLVKLIL